MSAICLLWIIHWGLGVFTVQNKSPSVSMKHPHHYEHRLQNQNMSRFCSWKSRWHCITAHRNIKPTTHRTHCCGPSEWEQNSNFDLKELQRKEEEVWQCWERQNIEHRAHSCLQHYKMSIWIWFKRAYWCLIKFRFANQSEVQVCQPSKPADRPARRNWAGAEGWFTGWGAWRVMYQDQFEQCSFSEWSDGRSSQTEIDWSDSPKSGDLVWDTWALAESIFMHNWISPFSISHHIYNVHYHKPPESMHT